MITHRLQKNSLSLNVKRATIISDIQDIVIVIQQISNKLYNSQKKKKKRKQFKFNLQKDR